MRCETPARQEETPASQAETPASQEETPASQEETPASQEETQVSQEETPKRHGTVCFCSLVLYLKNWIEALKNGLRH